MLVVVVVVVLLQIKKTKVFTAKGSHEVECHRYPCQGPCYLIQNSLKSKILRLQSCLPVELPVFNKDKVQKKTILPVAKTADEMQDG